MATRAKKGRKERVINPEKVTTMVEWADAYKNQYKNIVHANNGDLQVMDTEDLTALVKTIPHTLGEDATVVLASSKNVELRALAETKQSMLRETIESNTEQERTNFLEIEGDLLRMTNEWTHATDTAEKRNLAFRIGECTKQLQDAEFAVRSAMYPFRYVQTQDISRMLLQYAKKDDRIITVHTLALPYTDAQSRAITATGTA